MDFPYASLAVATPAGTIALGANVQAVVNALAIDAVAPIGDFGGPYVYWFQTFNNGTGNIVYTVFDRVTTLGLNSYTVRFGSAATILQIVFEPFPRSEIELLHVIMPNYGGISVQIPSTGTVTPEMPPVNIIPPVMKY